MQVQKKSTLTATGSALFQLLADMAKYPEKFELYMDNPDALTADYDLTEEQKNLIRVGGTENYIKLMVA
ncbi:MAG TPA: hypothetical protein DCL61_10935, partial [Cyanobacteria bacterium UBA12227]|nr:hypothetical protein [Cyanobacteria bacterium UBA12227]